MNTNNEINNDVDNIWLNIFKEKDDIYYKSNELISLNLEKQIISIANDMKEQYPQSSRDDCYKMAINLIIQRLLILQRQYANDSFKAMVINLFCFLPECEEFRFDLITQAKKTNSFSYKIKKLFKNFFGNHS